jgi:predicted metal-dependent enzyme (double-stranded beta helix superfamily)
MTNLVRLRDFVVALARIVETAPGDEAAEIRETTPLLAELVRRDDWLPDEYAAPDPKFYRQYLLHADPLGRFSVVSFVWGPGQRTPVHDHRTWGLIGILRGAELSLPYDRAPDGKFRAGEPERLEPGRVVAVSPTLGDVHAISHAYDDRVSISIHVYGANIGLVRRAVYDPSTGEDKPFISGYANASLPNLWNLTQAA